MIYVLWTATNSKYPDSAYSYHSTIENAKKAAEKRFCTSLSWNEHSTSGIKWVNPTTCVYAQISEEVIN